MKKSGMSVVIVIVAILGMFGLWFITTSNSLNTSLVTIEEKEGQVENVLQRRYDLIPNLVNAVKGSMKQEEKIFTSIADARKEYGNASTLEEKNDAGNKLSSEVGTLINVIQESYPTLNSNENVKTLMTQLEGTENRISVERKRYNESIATYNRKIVSFPTSIVANMKGMEKKEQFKAVEGADKAPEVNFD